MITELLGVTVADRALFQRHPRDDFLTKLMVTEEDGSRLTEFELLDICGLLFVAGHQTTSNLIGNGNLALLLHPSELWALRDEPGLLPSAVQELLRYDSPVQRVARMTRANETACGLLTNPRPDE